MNKGNLNSECKSKISSNIGSGNSTNFIDNEIKKF